MHPLALPTALADDWLRCRAAVGRPPGVCQNQPVRSSDSPPHQAVRIFAIPDQQEAPPMEFSLAEVHEAVANAIPEREALIFRDRRLSYGELRDRSRKLANYLLSRGLDVSAAPSALCS